MIIGIVGKANVGKSTFFKAATLAETEIANYPFVTIKANEGVGFVRTKCAEKFFKTKCNPQKGFCLNGERFVPVKLLDVAGLVPGAHEGKGLGNQFLSDLSNADVLIHVVDASGSTNEKGEPVKAGSYDPAKDVEFLEEEIDLWLYGIMLKGWRKFANQVSLESKPVDVSIAEHFSGLKINIGMVKKARSKLKLSKDLKNWSEEQIRKFATELRKASKPMIIAANKADVPAAKNNIIALKRKFKDYLIVPCSAESELALREAAKHDLIKYIPGEKSFEVLEAGKLNQKQKKALEFIKSKVLKGFGSTGVQQCLNTAVFELLKYLTAYPVPKANLQDAKGNVLPDAFLLPPRSTALDFAEKIHTDIAKGFVRAVDMKTKRTVGKDHKIKDGDVLEIISTK